MADTYELTLMLNARFLPIHRFALEDALQEVLTTLDMGSVDGGGTYQMPSGEIRACDIVLLLKDGSQDNIDKLARIVRSMGLPKGSSMKHETGETDIGTLEGLAVYLNGTDLPAETYKTCDINHVIHSLEEAMEGVGRMYSYWEGQTVTGLYFYGRSYEEMLELAKPFLDDYPLCRECRTEQIA